ncbi:MAG: HAMP domain-containing histidine kinase [Acidobacteriia bacterium]|nr:HAMP domain-containing histidine kinase [Terriglobia bacterium]
MNFRTKLFLIFFLTVGASVTAMGWGVERYTRDAFEEAEAARTSALVAQFQKEFSQQGEEVVNRVENIAGADATVTMAMRLAQPNADATIYVHDAIGAAQDHGLDFMEFAQYDGAIVSSAQYQARVGYKNEWIGAAQDWGSSDAFLKKEELPDGVALSLTAVRTVAVGDKNLYVIGGRRLDESFLASLVMPAGMRAMLYRNLEQGFIPSALSGPAGKIEQAEKFGPLIEDMQKNPRQIVETLEWSRDAADAEIFHAIPLLGRNKELLAVLLVGSPRRDLVLLLRRIQQIAVLSGAGALLIALLVTWWVSARITRPVVKLAEGARAVAAGDWEARIQPGGGGEIRQMGEAFNEMTRTLAAQRERLVQAERVAAWRELARRLAHELRNPLFPLQITLENLQRARSLSPEQFGEVFQESTQTMHAELANLNTIVGRFSDFSKMPAPQLQRTNINDAVRNAVRLFEPQFSAVGKPVITPEFYLDDALPEIDADPDLLHRALQNLVLNALDAMPAGGALKLRTFPLDKGVCIEVSDTGQGLTPEECLRLFTPYYTSKQHGTGLGLAIVQSVVSDHGGTISVSSEPGSGSTFHIELPLRPPNYPVIPGGDAPEPDSSPSGHDSGPEKNS